MRILPYVLPLLLLVSGCSGQTPASAPSEEQASATFEGDGYTLHLPSGWFAHRVRGGVLVTVEETIPSIPGPMGYTEKPQLAVQRIALGEESGIKDARAYLDLTATSPGREWVHVFEQREIAGLPGYWTVSDAAPLPGKLLRATAQADDATLFVFTAPRYESGSSDAAAIDGIIASFALAAPKEDAPAPAPADPATAPIETIVPET